MIKKTVANPMTLLKGLFLISIISLGSSHLLSQSITVTVLEKRPFEIDKIDIQLGLTEFSSDSSPSAVARSTTHPSLSNEQLLTELKSAGIQYKLLDTKPGQQYSNTGTAYFYGIQIRNEQELEKIQTILDNVSNIKMVQSEFTATNTEGTFAELTKQTIEKARKNANEIANPMGRETTDIINIQVINERTRKKPRKDSPYKDISQSASLKLEVTFDTKAIN